MDGVELASRFSYITNSLRFCGPKEASEQFISYLKSASSAESVRESIKKFEGLYPYLSVIAEKNKMDYLDYEVVESYWLGNRLLDNMDREDMIQIINKLTQRGLPKSIGSDLIRNLPDGMVPHHNFNVMYVGVGRTAGTVATTVKNMDNCRISAGKVVDFSGNNLIVQTDSLDLKNGKFELRKNEIKTSAYLRDFIPNPEAGSNVALHWGFACTILSDKQLENLNYYTYKVIDAINEN